MSKNSVFWEILQLGIHSKNYILNFFDAKYLIEYLFLIMQQFNFIIFLFYKLFFNMVVKTKFHASWHCVLLNRKVIMDQRRDNAMTNPLNVF